MWSKAKTCSSLAEITCLLPSGMPVFITNYRRKNGVLSTTFKQMNKRQTTKVDLTTELWNVSKSITKGTKRNGPIWNSLVKSISALEHIRIKSIYSFAYIQDIFIPFWVITFVCLWTGSLPFPRTPPHPTNFFPWSHKQKQEAVYNLT